MSKKIEEQDESEFYVIQPISIMPKKLKNKMDLNFICPALSLYISFLSVLLLVFMVVRFC
jgi:hypothetical protein